MIFRNRKKKENPDGRNVTSGVEHLKEVWHIDDASRQESPAPRNQSSDIYQGQNTGAVIIPRRRSGRSSSGKD